LDRQAALIHVVIKPGQIGVSQGEIRVEPDRVLQRRHGFVRPSPIVEIAGHRHQRQAESLDRRGGFTQAPAQLGNQSVQTLQHVLLIGRLGAPAAQSLARHAVGRFQRQQVPVAKVSNRASDEHAAIASLADLA